MGFGVQRIVTEELTGSGPGALHSSGRVDLGLLKSVKIGVKVGPNSVRGNSLKTIHKVSLSVTENGQMSFHSICTVRGLPCHHLPAIPLNSACR
jgi:hypothetical protein